MRKIVAVDFFDLVWQQTERIYSLEDIDALFARYAEYNVDSVLWRISACGKMLCHTKTPDQFKYIPGDKALAHKMCDELLDAYDPASAAVAAGKKYGVDVYFWVTLYDDAGYASDFQALESSICREHPEFSWRSKDGKSFYHGVLSYTYPEVVEFRLRQLRELIALGGAGLYLCNRSHSRSPEIRKAMKENAINGDYGKSWISANREFIESEFVRCRGLFGYDQPALATYHGDLDDVVAWQKHRGSYFIDFMKKVRELNPGKLWFGLRYAPNFGPYIYGDHFFDWEKLTDGTLVDGLAYDVQPPDFDKECDYPEFYRKTAGEKFVWMSLGVKNVKWLLDFHAESLERWRPHMNGLILFEAYQMTDNQEYWDFIKNF